MQAIVEYEKKAVYLSRSLPPHQNAWHDRAQEMSNICKWKNGNYFKPSLQYICLLKKCSTKGTSTTSSSHKIEGVITPSVWTPSKLCLLTMQFNKMPPSF